MPTPLRALSSNASRIAEVSIDSSTVEPVQPPFPSLIKRAKDSASARNPFIAGTEKEATKRGTPQVWAKCFAFSGSRLATATTLTEVEPARPAQKARAMAAVPSMPIRSGFSIDILSPVSALVTGLI